MDDRRLLTINTGSPRLKAALYRLREDTTETPELRERAGHVRAFNAQDTTTTPFDMVLLTGMSRYHLAAEALRGRLSLATRGSSPTLISECAAAIARATAYPREHFEGPPEISESSWTP